MANVFKPGNVVSKVLLLSAISGQVVDATGKVKHGIIFRYLRLLFAYQLIHRTSS
jgi:hypothetical protein